MIRVHDIHLPLDHKPEAIADAVARVLGLRPSALQHPRDRIRDSLGFVVQRQMDVVNTDHGSSPFEHRLCSLHAGHVAR